MNKKKSLKICPLGSIYIKGHYKQIDGQKHFWKPHCRNVGLKKFILNKDEIDEITKLVQDNKLKRPKNYNFKAPKGNAFDELISIWVKYWSSIFNIKTNITVHLVKTLMMSESTFGKNAIAKTHNRPGAAIGLLQITDYTLKLIQEKSTELRDHRFKVTREDLFDPNVNIAVAVRWLYRKREIAKYYLKKEPSALELAEEYKGIRADKSVKAQKQRDAFRSLWKEYRDAK